ncbi:hypothetical protein VD0002_g7075 [Verticillium dahliae]|uniref:Uncharacterized protein n=2 Tax=Verticillium dahliae TaxID=27337 RepID=G2WSG9_VERDV|nr:uncharacterized protein VDAG_01572 [Verticillium dahliae VdLs.17]KAF3342796.1 hypothetical protein VdG2_08783 [Verticillium dahliae VDG2]KAH6700853.1 hypothetical protein EV126DRAFT_251169 [Verticillium dahliae]EGY17890.1 hypothetical protein VDAG_01572 [Verticillium dahliae VdLs.17]PNH34046.1 hypothetical protein BJF96_g2892 [Verticillium dahliae]PNH48996.1 hypothetical protein VD0003_g8130 [Verticillium dahliae]
MSRPTDDLHVPSSRKAISNPSERTVCNHHHGQSWHDTTLRIARRIAKQQVILDNEAADRKKASRRRTDDREAPRRRTDDKEAPTLASASTSASLRERDSVSAHDSVNARRKRSVFLQNALGKFSQHSDLKILRQPVVEQPDPSAPATRRIQDDAATTRARK